MVQWIAVLAVLVCLSGSSLSRSWVGIDDDYNFEPSLADADDDESFRKPKYYSGDPSWESDEDYEDSGYFGQGYENEPSNQGYDHDSHSAGYQSHVHHQYDHHDHGYGHEYHDNHDDHKGHNKPGSWSNGGSYHNPGQMFYSNDDHGHSSQDGHHGQHGHNSGSQEPSQSGSNAQTGQNFGSQGRPSQPGSNGQSGQNSGSQGRPSQPGSNSQSSQNSGSQGRPNQLGSGAQTGQNSGTQGRPSQNGSPNRPGQNSGTQNNGQGSGNNADRIVFPGLNNQTPTTRPSSSPRPSTTAPTPTMNRALVDLVLCVRACPATPEYNPVCGTNNVTYNNPGILECARNCGVNVALSRRAPCPRLVPANSTARPSTTTTRAATTARTTSAPTRFTNINVVLGNSPNSTLIPLDALLSVFGQPSRSTKEPEFDIDRRREHTN